MTGKHARMVKAPDSEKLTINLGFVDLGHIDLLVRDGFYSNRSDFIRTAIRNQLATHADTARQAASRLTLELGLRTFRRRGSGSEFAYWVWRSSPTTSRPISPGRRSNRSPCSARCTRRPMSKPRSLIACADGFPTRTG